MFDVFIFYLLFKLTFSSIYFLGLYAENKLPTLEEILTMRDQGTISDEANPFFFFCTKFLSCTVGKRTWNKSKKFAIVSQIATVSDEVYTYLVLENCWDKWESIVENASIKLPTKYTHSTPSDLNKQKYSGWTREGLDRYNELFREVQKDRVSTNGIDTENRLLNCYVADETAKQKQPKQGNGLEGLVVMNDLGPDLIGTTTSATLLNDAADNTANTSLELNRVGSPDSNFPTNFNPRMYAA